MVGDESAFAEADCEGGFAAAAVAEGDDFGDVVPGLCHFGGVARRSGGGSGVVCCSPSKL